MDNQTAAGLGRARHVWRWGTGTAMVIGMLWAGSTLYEAAGRSASIAEGPASGAGGASADSGGRQAMTTDTTQHAAATTRPPIDGIPTPAVETATFALG